MGERVNIILRKKRGHGNFRLFFTGRMVVYGMLAGVSLMRFKGLAQASDAFRRKTPDHLIFFGGFYFTKKHRGFDMGLAHRPPFDTDAWHKKYFRTMNDLIRMHDENPHLNIDDVQLLVKLLDTVIERINKRHQIHQQIETMNQKLKNNAGAQ